MVTWSVLTLAMRTRVGAINPIMLNGLGSLMLLRFIDLVKLRGALKYAKKVRS